MLLCPNSGLMDDVACCPNSYSSIVNNELKVLFSPTGSSKIEMALYPTVLLHPYFNLVSIFVDDVSYTFIV